MIVVFGSINVDLLFQLDTLPRTGETVLTESCRIHPGGKGANTAVAAARAGGRTAMVGRVGRDLFAEHALSAMRGSGVELTWVEESAHPTGCASVWVDRLGENAIVVASGANRDVAAVQVPDWLLGEDTLVALQMEIAPEENWLLMERAKIAGARVLLNLAPARSVPVDALKDVDVLVVNQAEARALAAFLELAADRPVDTARTLAEAHGLACVVTLGPEGALACDPDAGWRIPALPVNVIDTTGAGDAFCGGLAAALDRRMDFETGLRYASVGAGIACTVEGAQPGMPDRETVASRLRDLPELQRLW